MAEYRPTLDELMLGKVEARDKVEEEVDTRGGKVIKFGWIEGVLMRCLLNIWGTISAVKRSIGSTTGFHNHREGPY